VNIVNLCDQTPTKHPLFHSLPLDASGISKRAFLPTGKLQTTRYDQNAWPPEVPPHTATIASPTQQFVAV